MHVGAETTLLVGKTCAVSRAPTQWASTQRSVILLRDAHQSRTLEYPNL